MRAGNVLAIVPARTGSKGIPNKNFTKLCGWTPVERAMKAASDAEISCVVLTSDSEDALMPYWTGRPPEFKSVYRRIHRPSELAMDDTPMIAVVQHVLQQIPGPSDQKILFYCFWRRTVEDFESIYGLDVVPLIIPASETCALDTQADWLEAERRLRERDALS